MAVTLGQLYKGEKPTVIPYTYYIDRHAKAPNITEHIIIYDNRAIEPYKNRGLGQR